jgi:osmotically-inducible protein OsmY
MKPTMSLIGAVALALASTFACAQGPAVPAVDTSAASAISGQNAKGISDKQLQANVRQALRKAKRAGFSFSNVRVRVTNGVVLLTGTVPGKDQIAAAARIVGAVPGVTVIINRLIVHVELNGYGGQ